MLGVFQEQNCAAISQTGLDPKRRAGQAMGPGEYFGTDMPTSLGYCAGGSRMLVFAVLLDASGLTHASGTGLGSSSQSSSCNWGEGRRLSDGRMFGSQHGRQQELVPEARKKQGPGVVVVHK